MKRLFIPVILLFAACNPHAKEAKRQKYMDTTGVLEALYVTDGNTLALLAGPVKKVRIGAYLQVVDSLTDPDHHEVVQKFMEDSFYLLPNVDSTIVIKDSTGKPALTKDGKLQYGNSFKKALMIPRNYVTETTIKFPQVK